MRPQCGTQQDHETAWMDLAAALPSMGKWASIPLSPFTPPDHWPPVTHLGPISGPAGRVEGTARPKVS